MQAVSASPMFVKPVTRRLAYRFFWKEGRRLFGLSLGIAAMTLAVMLGLTLFGPTSSRPAQLMTIAFGGAAMLSVAAAVIATLVTLAALIVVSWVVARGLPPGPQAATIVAQGFTAIVEAFVWSLLASLVCRHPLIAAVLGMVAASLNSQLAIALWLPSARGFELRDLQAALPIRWALIGAVAAINGWLGMRWLPVNAEGALRSTERFARKKSHTAASQATVSRRKRLTAFVRLLWQSVRQSWAVASAVLVLGVFLSVAFSLVTRMLVDSSHSWSNLAVGGVLFAPALLGAVVFRADQRRGQYRFLAEHAGRPRTLWLARIVTGLTPLVVVLAIGCFFVWVVGSQAVQNSSFGNYHRYIMADGDRYGRSGLR